MVISERRGGSFCWAHSAISWPPANKGLASRSAEIPQSKVSSASAACQRSPGGKSWLSSPPHLRLTFGSWQQGAPLRVFILTPPDLPPVNHFLTTYFRIQVLRKSLKNTHFSPWHTQVTSKHCLVIFWYTTHSNNLKTQKLISRRELKTWANNFCQDICSETKETDWER